MPGLSELVGRHTVPMLKTIHYTDEAIGDFFERARARPWFARTLFVVTSDHGLPIAPLDGELTMHRLEGLRHRVPLLFYAPSWLAPATRPGPASLADVAPTILGLFALRAPQAGVGCDLLDPGGCDPSRPVVAWDDEAQTVSFVTGRLVYHRAAASSPGSDAPAEERLVDSKADPLGKRDVSASEASALARLRRLSDVYLEVYPRVVLGDRSGVPPSVPPIAGAAP